MPSRGCPLPPEGRGWGPAKSPCGGGSAGGPAVAWCSGSVVIVTGAPILRRALPAESAAATTAGRQPAAPAKLGRPARSPRPATGLPGTPQPAARDGSYFPRDLRFGQYRGSGAFPLRKRTGKLPRGGSICRLPRIRTRLYHLRPHPQGNPHFVRGADNQEREKP